ncbi:hypothetical protein ACWGAN_22525 [Streptomyces sp. NPDC054945]
MSAGEDKAGLWAGRGRLLFGLEAVGLGQVPHLVTDNDPGRLRLR